MHIYKVKFDTSISSHTMLITSRLNSIALAVQIKGHYNPTGYISIKKLL
jgi:hypothetical protein